jgi:ABC-type enterobactin transport system permease subunit
MSRRQRYTLVNFGIDALLTVLTGGIWLIWVFVREMRNR